MKTVLLDGKKHNRQTFDCGIAPLNHFLQKTANQQSLRDHGRTYVIEDGDDIAGFYTLTMIRITLSDIPQALRKKHGSSQVAGLVARLAVDVHYQGRGYGGFLLYDALCRLYQAGNSIGFPLVLVDAKEGKASFYERYGFEPVAEGRLFITLRTIGDLIARIESLSI